MGFRVATVLARSSSGVSHITANCTKEELVQPSAQHVTLTTRQKLEKGNAMSSDISRIEPKYQSEHFNHVPHALATELWDFLHRPETVTRLRTATAMGRPAVEGISESLVAEFGREITERAAKQVAGHMVRLTMESLGYVVHKPRARTSSGIFSTGMVFRPVIPSGRDSFNCWLDARVKSPDGEIDPDKLAQVAHEWGVKFSAKRCNVSFRRLELGALLRAVVPKSEYDETSADDEQVQRGSHEPDQRQFPGIPDDRAEFEAHGRKLSRRRT
jgi:hypothetical protein